MRWHVRTLTQDFALVVQSSESAVMTEGSVGLRRAIRSMTNDLYMINECQRRNSACIHIG